MFNQLSPVLLGMIFVAAAAVVWFAGSRLAGYVDGIARETGAGQAFMGMLLLGGITSLPEVAAVSTSAAIGSAPLAVNNLLGSASVNLILLGIADVIFGRDALTSFAASPGTLMQGLLSMVLAAVVALLATIGDVPVLGVGAGSVSLLALCLAALWLASRYERRHVWTVAQAPNEPSAADERSNESHGEWPLRKLVLATIFAGAAILVAGFVLSMCADAIAARSGIDSGLIGFLLVAAATSLPEVSSIVGAVRLRRYEMAVGDIFGTNIFNLILIFLVDAIYRGEPVLDTTGTFEVVGAILAVLLTGIFAIGLLERRDRTVLRMGYDSLAAFAVFVGGVFALYSVGGSGQGG